MTTYEDLMDYSPVTLEQAKLLKSLGFRGKTKWYWQNTEGIPYVHKGLKISQDPVDHNDPQYQGIDIYSAPSKKDVVVLKVLASHLRSTTGVGVFTCKKALVDNDLDIEKATAQAIARSDIVLSDGEG